MADTAIAEAKMEEKYDIELVNVDKKGNAQYVSTSKEAQPKKQEYVCFCLKLNLLLKYLYYISTLKLWEKVKT